jgi:hypothetical protein
MQYTMMVVVNIMRKLRLRINNGMEKVKTFWEKKSTDILIGIIIILFIGGLKLYDSKEDLRSQKAEEAHRDIMELLYQQVKANERQDELLSEVAIQIKARWGYDIVNKKSDSTWIKLWQEANKKRNTRGGSSSVIENNDDLINNIQYAPEESTIANTRAR